MAHSSAQTNIAGNSMNNNTNSNSNNNNNVSSSSGSGTIVVLQRHASQPIDITAPTNNGAFVKPSAPTVAQQLAFNKMEKKKSNRRFDKNLTFSTPVDDPVMDEDFDFEKNLALFDKQAIWDKIDANQKPDLVSSTCD